jgi:hypothetical protein
VQPISNDLYERHTGYLVEHTGLSFRKVAHSWYDVRSTMFWTEYIGINAFLGGITLLNVYILRFQV